MKTLADLKKDLVIGKCLVLRNRWGSIEGRNIGVPRFVVKRNTVGVCLSKDKTKTDGSFFDWPKASLLEYDGKTITVYQSGSRPLTDEEKRILKGQPEDAEQAYNDIMTDGSTMFYRQKCYFEKSGKFYLFGVSVQAGKQLKNGTRKTFDDGSFSDWSVNDDKCKGNVGLAYEIIE